MREFRLSGSVRGASRNGRPYREDPTSSTTSVDATHIIGLAVGGKPGSRLAHWIGMPASGDTLLRLVRSARWEAPQALRIIGLDEWAWKRRQTCYVSLVTAVRFIVKSTPGFGKSFTENTVLAGL